MANQPVRGHMSLGGSQAWCDWIDSLAESQQRTRSQVAEILIAAGAAAKGYPPPPSRVTKRSRKWKTNSTVGAGTTE